MSENLLLFVAIAPLVLIYFGGFLYVFRLDLKEAARLGGEEQRAMDRLRKAAEYAKLRALARRYEDELEFGSSHLDVETLSACAERARKEADFLYSELYPPQSTDPEKDP